MSAETFLIWLVVGLVAGWLASKVVGSSLGVAGDIVIGIVGSFLGGLIFRTAHIGTPFRGVVATIFVAFVGAVVLLLVLRLVRRGTPRRL
ncbi:MAG TPA: GlsB/YeaQ/YmgE family stress response membrane protein [Polyangia bacterium]|nr:GlsB/YeaQ/YmgE family stress response membrane protein [Polyangia bacterium]